MIAFEVLRDSCCQYIHCEEYLAKRNMIRTMIMLIIMIIKDNSDNDCNNSIDNNNGQ